MSTTAYGYKIPEFEDPSATWMAYLEDNWTRISAHDHDGVDSVKLTSSSINSGAATSGQVLTADGAGAASFQTPASAATSFLDVRNLGLSVTESGDDIIIALKTQDGGDPGSSDYPTIGFRSPTAASGSYNALTRTSALSLTLAGAVTLGGASGVARKIYVYAVDVDTTGASMILAASLLRLDDRVLTSTSTTGTSNQVLYSGSAVVSKPIRCLGSFTATNTTNTWGTPTPVNVGFQPYQIIKAAYEMSSGTGNGTLVTDGTVEIVDFNVKLYDPLNIVTTGTSWAAVMPCAGKLTISAKAGLASETADGVNDAFTVSLYVGGSLKKILGTFRYQTTGAAVTASANGMTEWDVAAGDSVNIRCSTNNGAGSPTAFDTDGNQTFVSLSLVPAALI